LSAYCFLPASLLAPREFTKDGNFIFNRYVRIEVLLLVSILETVPCD
jgi:hypothetical protein